MGFTLAVSRQAGNPLKSLLRLKLNLTSVDVFLLQ